VTLRAYDQSGNRIPDNLVTWTSSDPLIAQVIGGNQLRASTTATGHVSVTATVRDGTAAPITSPPAGFTVN